MLQNEVNEICLLCADNAFSFNEEFELVEKRRGKNGEQKVQQKEIQM